MSQLKKHIDNRYQHPDLGEIEVLQKVPKSRTKLEVKVVDRGSGYNVSKKRYTGIKLPGGWMRGENYEFGHVDEVHHKNLQSIKNEQHDPV